MNTAFQSDQRAALSQLITALRDCIEHSVTVNASAGELRELGHQAEALAAAMGMRSGHKALEHFNSDFGEDVAAILPCSPITGTYNPLAPPVTLERNNERLLGRVTLGHAYEGPPGLVHGSIVAAIYDQIMAFAALLRNVGGFTANLSVDYIAGTPIFEPLLFSA